jgi:hypothetical protein
MNLRGCTSESYGIYVGNKHLYAYLATVIGSVLGDYGIYTKSDNVNCTTKTIIKYRDGWHDIYHRTKWDRRADTQWLVQVWHGRGGRKGMRGWGTRG